ncbi:Uncharacterized protein APZ42_027239 [Daphnia magna]|uniref:Uncharacterized protein n=1 Tax=Daphnia magna TaxID=35525 RepID=A0A164RDG4_9CRUS|nr:Uncharacterized protein APZ42_027239 [Daphnia magna]
MPLFSDVTKRLHAFSFRITVAISPLRSILCLHSCWK